MKNKTRVPPQLPLVGGFAALALLLFAPENVKAQTTVLFACYVPNVGAIYMIQLTGLPVNCLSPTHVEISWSAAVGDGHRGA